MPIIDELHRLLLPHIGGRTQLTKGYSSIPHNCIQCLYGQMQIISTSTGICSQRYERITIITMLGGDIHYISELDDGRVREDIVFQLCDPDCFDNVVAHFVKQHPKLPKHECKTIEITTSSSSPIVKV